MKTRFAISFMLCASLNPGMKLPNLTIASMVRQDWSGITFAFTKHLRGAGQPPVRGETMTRSTL